MCVGDLQRVVLCFVVRVSDTEVVVGVIVVMSDALLVNDNPWVLLFIILSIVGDSSHFYCVC